MKINNLKVKNYELLSISERSNFDYIVVNYVKANPILRVGYLSFKPKWDDFFDMKWSELIDLRKAIKKGQMFEVIRIVYGRPNRITLSDKFLENTNAIHFFSVYKSITEKLKKVVDLETKMLSDKPTELELNAGIEMFEMFGEQNAITALSHNMLWMEDKVKSMPYATIFRKLCENHTSKVYQKNYNELLK